MVDGDSQKFVAALHGLASAFRVQLTDEQVEVFWLALRDEMTIEAFQQACLISAKRAKFFPPPAALLENRPAVTPALPAWETEPRPIWTAEQKAEARALRERLALESGRARLPRDGGTIERPGWGCDEFEP
jgi:hypothetical protein